MTRAEWKIERSYRQPSARRGLAVPDSRAGIVIAPQYGCDQVSSGMRPITTLRNSRRGSVMSQTIQVARVAQSLHAFRLSNEMGGAVAFARLPILTSPNDRDLQPVLLETA